MSEHFQPLKSIQLESGPDGPSLILPSTGKGNDRSALAPLPHFPFSTLSWLGAFGQTVWQQHEVCTALLLLVNPERMCWGITAPVQTPRRDGVSWRLADAVPKGDLDPSRLFVGGSFQTSILTSLDDAADLVPATDGLHLISPVNIKPAGTWCFLRVGGQLDAIDPQTMVTDDWGLRIAEVMRYLNLPD